MSEITIDVDGAMTGTTLPRALEEVIEAADKLPHDSSPGEAVAVVGAMVPIFLFFAVAATFIAKYYFNSRARREAQATVRAAIERGEPLTPDLLDRLVQAPAPKRNDLRRGVIWVGLGLGIGAFGLILGEEDAVRPMLATGLVPLLLGIAYLVLWRLSRDKAAN